MLVDILLLLFIYNWHLVHLTNTTLYNLICIDIHTLIGGIYQSMLVDILLFLNRIF